MEKFNVATKSFRGPLETLLNLIEERKMSISDVSLAAVTDAYLSYVEALPELPLSETAQFILIASTLLLIKSRSLLPTLELSEGERESVEELERRLAQYALVRKAGKLIKKEWGRAPLPLARRAPEREALFSPAESSIARILKSVERLVKLLPKPEMLARTVVAPVLALEEVIMRVRDRLMSTLKASFREMTHSSDRQERIVYFLAMLELVRSGSASVSQEKLFSDITIELEVEGAPRFGM